MFNALEQKIQEIRRQPEHIRLRYMWGAIAVCMTFVVMIWLMSVRINIGKAMHKPQTQAVREGIREQLTNTATKNTENSNTADGVSIRDLIAPEQPSTTR